MLLNNSKNKNKNSTSSLDCGSKSIIFPDCGLRLYIHSVNTLRKMIDYLNKYTINLVN